MELNLVVRNAEFNKFAPEYLDVILDEAQENITVDYYKVINAEMGADENESVTGYSSSRYTKKSTVTFPISDIDNKFNTFCIYLNIIGDLLPPLNQSKYVGASRTGYSIFSNAFKIFDFNAVLLLKQDGEKFVVVSQKIPIKNTNFTNVILFEGAAMSSEVLNSCFDYKYNKELEMADYKRKKVLLELDPNDSLSYMEAQLDILTKLVFTLLDALDPSIKNVIKSQFPDLNSVEAALMNTSLLNVKDIEHCMREINTTKTKVREIQQNYYEFKSQQGL